MILGRNVKPERRRGTYIVPKKELKRGGTDNNMGLTLIFAAISIILCACLIRERRKSAYWFDEWSELTKENWRLRIRLRDEQNNKK